MPRATDLLREDHSKVKDLFRRFDDTDDEKERRAIADQSIMELEIHSQVEEEIFYPAVRRREKGDEEMADTMNEADEEHHVADMLIKELKAMRGGGPKFAAKFTVLAENVKHHIQEEESEILTKAAEGGESFLQELGAEMEQRKTELMSSYGKGRTKSGSTRTKTSTRKASTKKAAASRPKAGTGSRNGAARTKGAAASRVSATRKTSSARSASNKSGAPRKTASRSR